jgi:hypothetical protein
MPQLGSRKLDELAKFGSADLRRVEGCPAGSRVAAGHVA